MRSCEWYLGQIKQFWTPMKVDFPFLMSFEDFWSQEPPIVAVHVSPTIPESYYEQALASVEYETAILFGGDLDIEGNFYRFGTSGAELTDVQLMSFCDGHVISDDPLSWWGAYVSDDEKVVYPYPNHHYAVPVTWKRIDL